LPNFSFAGESGYAAVFADVQPCANVLWQLFVVKAPVPRRCLLRHHRIFRNCEDGDSRAKNSEKIAARQFELMERSEEHTSELQSRFDLVCRLLLEKKKSRHLSALR